MKSERIFVDSQNVVLRTFTSQQWECIIRTPFLLRIFFVMVYHVPLFPFIFKLSTSSLFLFFRRSLFGLNLSLFSNIHFNTEVFCFLFSVLMRSNSYCWEVNTSGRTSEGVCEKCASTHSLLHHIAFNVHLLVAHWLCNTLFRTFYYARGWARVYVCLFAFNDLFNLISMS